MNPGHARTHPAIPPGVTGLSAEELTATARDYFARFRWNPPALDPDRLSAERFLSFVVASAPRRP